MACLYTVPLRCCMREFDTPACSGEAAHQSWPLSNNLMSGSVPVVICYPVMPQARASRQGTALAIPLSWFRQPWVRWPGSMASLQKCVMSGIWEAKPQCSCPPSLAVSLFPALSSWASKGSSSTQWHNDLCEWCSMILPGLAWRVYQLWTS